jgi:hypothetical protein
MRIRDVIIVSGAFLIFISYLFEFVSLNLPPLITLIVFAIFSTFPYFVKNSRLRFFGALVYWTVGGFLSSAEMLKDYFFILALGIGNAAGAVISTIEKGEHSYMYSISATAAYFSSFLIDFTSQYPDVSTLTIVLLVLLSAMWVYFFQDLKASQLGLREHLTQTLKTSLFTSPIFLLLLVIPSYIYNVLDVSTSDLGVVLFRYVLLSFVATFTGCMLRDFVTYLGGYRRDYLDDRAVFRKL